MHKLLEDIFQEINITYKGKIENDIKSEDCCRWENNLLGK